jgi:hypothetical protein
MQAEGFKTEAELQNGMLDHLNNDIDRVNDKMIKVDTKMKSLIKSSS